VGQLFASNAIVPMLSFVYWPTVVGPAREEVINIATLAGCIVGMILFGVMGDVYGRRKMYGIELIVLIFGTVGVLMSSNGFASGDGLSGSMDIQSWLVFFRFVSGVGLGGVSTPILLIVSFLCLPSFPVFQDSPQTASKAGKVGNLIALPTSICQLACTLLTIRDA
jgi:MFS family permease